MPQRAVILGYTECAFDENGEDLVITPLVCFIGNAIRDTVSIPVTGISITDVAPIIQAKIKDAIIAAAPTAGTGYNEIGITNILGVLLERV